MSRKKKQTDIVSEQTQENVTQTPIETQQSNSVENKKKRILIGITTAETVSYETMQSIYGLMIPENVETALSIVNSYNVADGRNKLVDIMLEQDFDYIFFVDNDVILPTNALVDLFGMDWYFVAGTYPRKELSALTDKEQYTTLYNHDERNKEVYCPTFMRFDDFPADKLTQVDCCGFGCTLIRRDLFNVIEKPYFFFAHEEAPKPDVRAEYCIGEDMYFCRKVVKSGLQIWAHGNVLCGHLGKIIYTLNRS
jgi:hypothetical protein